MNFFTEGNPFISFGNDYSIYVLKDDKLKRCNIDDYVFVLEYLNIVYFKNIIIEKLKNLKVNNLLFPHEIGGFL